MRRQRRSPRLAGYDYSQAGAYFVTFCTHERQHLFGEVIDGMIQLTPAGAIAWRCWDEIPVHFPTVEIDHVVVMPNHVHGIIVIQSTPPAPDSKTPAPPSLNTVIGLYKSTVTKFIRREDDPSIAQVWQRSYHDHVIRTEEELARIRDYINTNPQRWHEDTYYPSM